MQIINECFLEEDEKILKSTFNSENDKKSDTEKVITFNKKKDYELVRVLENTLLILLFSEINIKIIFYI